MVNVSWRRKVQSSTCVAVRRVRCDHEKILMGYSNALGGLGVMILMITPSRRDANVC